MDISDNIIDGAVIPPADVVRHDEDDLIWLLLLTKALPFSISPTPLLLMVLVRGCLASGGSNGYDHKKMGITAKGAWESVKRHFREMGVDCQTTAFSCVAVGDMAGDVFGNGMLLSEFTCLVGAFNHMHIFIDPTPDPKTSYQERQRLFKLPRSGWDDYDRKLISRAVDLFTVLNPSI